MIKVAAVFGAIVRLALSIKAKIQFGYTNKQSIYLL